ncbi:MarR family winged helix-turn-helix transcriptional regulator [Streptomyces odontomachi]|uniref:MarR family winged helix-turn-helix transcriptional regulator n=1 Tax=Streptomyces odontomachi TaxID=2944940 RepID=UPI00210BB434|nr:MarR family transcriptional regulator [Streptomyces sp. ODS25]
MQQPWIYWIQRPWIYAERMVSVNSSDARPHDAQAVALRRGIVRLGRRLRQERPAGSLTPNQLGVLSHLGRHGPSTPGEVAAAERQRPQSLTRTFAELEAEGLIVRSPDREDRRQSLLSVTPRGRGVLVEDMANRDVWLAAALDTLTETEREVLRLAGALMERLAGVEEAPAD